MQKNVVFWWDELLQVCGWHGTTFRVGKRSPAQGETVRSVKNMEERLRSEKWKRYEEFLVEGEKSPATVRKYIHDIQAFYLWLEEKELSKETLKEYKSWLSENYKISSANSMIISLNLYLKFCGHAECCLKTFKIQKKMFLEKDLELSKEEYFRLLRAAGKGSRLQAVMETIAATGIRVGELRFITVRSVDKEDGDLTDQINIVDNTVDTTKAGLYSVTYKVTDKGGASAEKTINVVVKEKTAPPTTVSQDGSANGTKTGDAMPIGMLAVLMLAATAGIVFCGRKLYKNR